MRLISRGFLCILLVALLGMTLTASAQRLPDAPATQTVTYAASDENFPNPERGFYDQDAPLWLKTERNPQSVETLRALREDGISLVRWYLLIDEFRGKPISQNALNFIDRQFDVAREAGVKVIPRFAYNFPMGGEYPYKDPDAPLSRVLAHLDQLKPVLRANADVIAFMEIGFVGAWGEWHSSTNKLVSEKNGVNNASRQIVARLLAVLPKNRMIAMRYAPYKQQLYGANPISSANAFSGKAKARMGAHNDCFLASDTDWGTYPSDPDARAALRQYLNQDNRYVPQGGETCNNGADAQPYVGCDNALIDLALIRFSALNRDYHPDVLQGWKDGGCYDEIARRLGYRLRLIDAELPTEAVPGGAFAATITLVNEGFASPYNPRRFEILLRAQSDGAIYRVVLANKPDPRRWLPDDGEIALNLAGTLPASIPAGGYDLLLNLSDPKPALRGRPEYSIRLANAEVWEAETGYNRLMATLNVGAGG
jgi:hypothetical protein